MECGHYAATDMAACSVRRCDVRWRRQNTHARIFRSILALLCIFAGVRWSTNVCKHNTHTQTQTHTENILSNIHSSTLLRRSVRRWHGVDMHWSTSSASLQLPMSMTAVCVCVFVCETGGKNAMPMSSAFHLFSKPKRTNVSTHTHTHKSLQCRPQRSFRMERSFVA